MESNYRINIKTTADTSGIDKADQALAELKGDFARANASIDAKLAELRGNAAATGEQAGGELGDGVSRGARGAKAFDIDELLGKASAVGAAAAVGVEIGTALGDAITRMAERGVSWNSILGRYDARFDESLARWRDGIRAAMDELGKAPEPTLLEYLKQVDEAAKSAVATLEHLDRLEKMKTDADREVVDEQRQEERKQIEEDVTLTPEQRDEALAGFDKSVINEQAARREQDRLRKETEALDREEVALDEAAKASAAYDEQLGRAQTANQYDQHLQQKWTDSGNKGKFSDSDYGQQWADQNREEFAGGVGSFEDEQKRLGQVEKEKSDAAGKAEAARVARERVSEVNQQEEEIDRNRVSRQMRNIDDGVATRRQQRSQEAAGQGGGAVDTEKLDQAASAATSAAQEVGKSAEQLATSTADSSNQIAGDLRQLTESVGSALTGIQAAVADNSRAISALAQRTESAAAMASAALAAANDTRANSRAFNGGRR